MNSLNDNKKLIDELANLLNETAEAHHKAFAATEGEDPDWPIWYADYLLDKMRQMLNAKFTKSELIYLLVSAEKKNGVVAPGAYWPRFYANFIISRYM
jgi:NAD(P)H-hydrate epimerase